MADLFVLVRELPSSVQLQDKLADQKNLVAAALWQLPLFRVVSVSGSQLRHQIHQTMAANHPVTGFSVVFKNLQ